jgi:hypothetical protein
MRETRVTVDLSMKNRESRHVRFDRFSHSFPRNPCRSVGGITLAMPMRGPRLVARLRHNQEMSTYVIRPISSKTIDQAYPLAKVLEPSLTRREWRELCLAQNPLALREAEKVIIALNARGYVKGLCVYCVRDHPTYGRLLDIPLFIVASAADAEGAAEDFLNFLRKVCDASVCSGIRFWTLSPDAWRRRFDPEEIGRSDHGLFMPALPSVAEFEKALRVRAIGGAETIVRFSD